MATRLSTYVPTRGIPVVDGWTLIEDRQTAHSCEYAARSAAGDRFIQVSQFHFTPTPERWSWLVRHGFPGQIKRPGGTFTPITDEDIDLALLDDGPSCLHCSRPSGCAPEPCEAYSPRKDLLVGALAMVPVAALATGLVVFASSGAF